MKVLSFILGWFLIVPLVTYAGQAREMPAEQSLPPIPFSLDELHSRIDRTHPLLRGAGAEKTIARGKMLKALGAFEPTLVNDTELERFISSSDSSRGTQTVGYNDTLVEALHPSGFKGSAGFRQAIGDARIPDLSFGNGNQQVILGGYLPLLRGLMINPERAELQRSELANPLAEIKIAQTRQGLFLAAAHQFWEWVSAAKLVDIQKRAVAVAEDRYKQVEERAKAGAVAPIDVTEAGQEVHRRREVAIAARRLLEQEQFKLSMFLWEHGSPTIPPIDRVPEFPAARQALTVGEVTAHKLEAMKERPGSTISTSLWQRTTSFQVLISRQHQPVLRRNLFLGWGIDSVSN
jgi:outer membrane protein TolC